MTPREKTPPVPSAKALRTAGVANDNDPLVVTLTVSQLRAMMQEAVANAPAAERAPLLDKQRLARLLDCSAAHIDMLRKQGLPTVLVGQAVRFDGEAVIAWLKAANNQGGATTNQDRET